MDNNDLYSKTTWLEGFSLEEVEFIKKHQLIPMRVATAAHIQVSFANDETHKRLSTLRFLEGAWIAGVSSPVCMLVVEKTLHTGDTASLILGVGMAVLMATLFHEAMTSTIQFVTNVLKGK
jgi:hypothetical protein